MIKIMFICLAMLHYAGVNIVYGQEEGKPVAQESFTNTAANVQAQLTESLAELTALRDEISKSKIPLSRKLSDLENELVKIRLDFQQTTRTLDSRLLDLSNLNAEIKTRNEESTYLSNLLGEYVRNFEAGLHIAELQRYHKTLETAKLAAENTKLSTSEVYKAQTALVSASIERLNEALSGDSFKGNAVVAGGIVKPGSYVLVGPAAFFKSDDGKNVGTAEQRLGSLEPTVIDFDSKEDFKAASTLISASEGMLPFDVTLGNAHKVEGTKTTLWQHIRMGGMIMFPILLLGAASMSVACYKWYSMRSLSTPSQKQISEFFNAVALNRYEQAIGETRKIGGPTGKMLAAGLEQITTSKELMEEVMFEVVLTTKLRLNSFLPFIALSATCAPLLGLLGTVTGIITTFSLITVFGSGDPKTLSGGISEALIGTEFGLYVAIPSLVIHSFLLRKSRGVIEQMERTALAFVNQVSKNPSEPDLIERKWINS